MSGVDLHQGPPDGGRGHPSNRRRLPDMAGMGVQVWLKADKHHTAKHLLKTPFVFQCPPLETWSWDQVNNWNDWETIERGIFSRPQSQGLRTIDFSSLFVDYDASYAVAHPRDSRSDGSRDVDDYAEDFTTPLNLRARNRHGKPGGKNHKRKHQRWQPNPIHLSKELRQIMNSETPFRLLVGQPRLWDRWDIEILATIRSLHVEERAGEVDARYFDISFTEWREPKLGRRKKGSRFPLKHDVKPGDTLHKLSKKYYGGYGGWRHIRKANDKRLPQGVGAEQDLSKIVVHGHKIRSLTIPKKPNSMRDHHDGGGNKGGGAGSGGRGGSGGNN